MNADDPEYTCALENICRSQLDAQTWTDSLNQAYDDILQGDLVKIMTHFQEEKLKRGKEKTDFLIRRSFENAEAKKKLAIYLPVTLNDYINAIDFNLCGSSPIIKDLIKTYPEYIDDIYVL